jgi:hypothetical protein
MSRLRQSIFPFISKQRLLVESCRHRRLTPCRHRRLPPPKTARPSSVPAASPRPPLPLRRHHGHHHRQYRSYHRHHRRRCHHHHHQLPLPPPRSPASSSPGGKQAQPALLRPCALHPRPCELRVPLLSASGVGGDAVATRCACSRGTGAHLSHPAFTETLRPLVTDPLVTRNMVVSYDPLGPQRGS